MDRDRQSRESRPKRVLKCSPTRLPKPAKTNTKISPGQEWTGQQSQMSYECLPAPLSLARQVRVRGEEVRCERAPVLSLASREDVSAGGLVLSR